MNNIIRDQAVQEVKKCADNRVNVLRQMVALKAAYKDLNKRIQDCRVHAMMVGPSIVACMINPNLAQYSLEKMKEQSVEMSALTDERIGLDLRMEQLMQMKEDAHARLHDAVETVLGLNTGDPVEDLMASANALAYVEIMHARERELANA